MKYEEILEEAFDYAIGAKSFSKTSIVAQASHVCVFGLGRYFEEAFFIQNVKTRFGVEYLCDNNENRLDELKQDGRVQGMKLVSPKELIQLENVAVIIMLGNPASAIEQLTPMVGAQNCISYNDLILDDVMGADRDISFYLAEKEKILEIYHLLADEESKKIFTNVFCLRVAPHLAQYSYSELCSEPQYFPQDILPFDDHENIVDCGAYDGDTLDSFLKYKGERFDSYRAFELDFDNFARLQNKVGNISNEKIFCYPYGVWSENKKLSYGKMASSDSYSIFNSRETEIAQVVSLDAFIGKEKVSMIKMDIEGSEKEALRGCQRIIKEQRPKLAICIYHRVEDLWQIPEYIHSLCQDYEIYVRHHAKYWVAETVCYAIKR